ncbi:MAG: hypothetical protein NVSMB47_05540 [Polyangiales bacterium]
MTDIPPLAYVIGALGIVYLLVRAWVARGEAQRRAAREARMEQLYAEREAPPSSLIAVTRDSDRPAAADKGDGVAGGAARETIKVRCRACKALNDESATACGSCGAAL